MARILDNDLLGDEEYVERTLRPQYFKEYIGQDKVKDQLKIFIEAAKLRDEALDHTLLFGPPGLGKTTMAFVIANEMGVNLKQTSGPAIEKAGDLVCSKSNRGRYASPALAAASYPFVDLPSGDTLRCKLFPADKFHKICYLFDKQ